MLLFPQLTSGSIAQLPIGKLLRRRRIINELASGSLIILPDLSVSVIEWNLQYVGLSESEWMALYQLFQASEGQLNAFLMLDPLGNLLAWSEDFTRDIWHKDGLLRLTAQVTDPAGTARATRIENIGTATQSLSQTLDAPSWYRYCFSFYARAATAGSLRMVISNTQDTAGETMVVTPAWRRYSGSSELAGSDTAITFSLMLMPEASVEMFGLQVEPQRQPSSYKVAGVQSGVYPQTRFLQDLLTASADSLGEYSTRLLLVSRTGL